MSIRLPTGWLRSLIEAEEWATGRKVRAVHLPPILMAGLAQELYEGTSLASSGIPPGGCITFMGIPVVLTVDAPRLELRGLSAAKLGATER